MLASTCCHHIKRTQAVITLNAHIPPYTLQHCGCYLCRLTCYILLFFLFLKSLREGCVWCSSVWDWLRETTGRGLYWWGWRAEIDSSAFFWCVCMCGSAGWCTDVGLMHCDQSPTYGPGGTRTHLREQLCGAAQEKPNTPSRRWGG